MNLELNHPYVYREHDTELEDVLNLEESSPCIWGAPSWYLLELYCLGIIPMYMGSTFHCFIYPISTKNHPHVYGEHDTTVSGINVGVESSSCIWGAPKYTPIGTEHFRIILMYMGSTDMWTPPLFIYKNHPHVYGEHKFVPFSSVPSMESSSCIWGALDEIKDVES